MNKKKFMGWIIGVPVLIALLVVLIVSNESEEAGLSRGMAYKAIALMAASRDECQARQKEQGGSRFPLKEQNNWYVKYMDYLYGTGLISEKLTPATAQSAEGWITYGEVEALMEKLDPGLKKDVRAGKKNKSKPFPATQWWYLYDSLCRKLDTGHKVKELDLKIFGTPLNLKGMAQWTAYTDQGKFGFEGLGLDAYIDQELKVLARDNEIITIKEVTRDTATFKNLWLAPGDGQMFIAHLGSESREFPLDPSLGQPAGFLNNLADLTLHKGKLQKLTLKKDRIKGKKVLAVKSDAIEIEGYGSVKLDPDFRVYKVYGQFQEEKRSDILVGYDIQEFVVAGGKLCAALTVREFDAKTIRVLLMDTGFHSIFHKSVDVTADQDMEVLYGEEKEMVPAGKELVLAMDDKRLDQGRVVLKLPSGKGSITVKSIERAQGNPSYGGTLEISREKDGLVLVNELLLEDYLTKVVPSEMPENYNKEALKAQAVCARTYAYLQIQGNSYSQYGAHVDDSTRYQVYNNIKPDPRTDAAVRETYGKLLFYGGKPIEAYYFSTSCGHTTDGSVWGGDPGNTPYLEGVVLRDTRETLNLTTNSAFEKFIKDKDFPSYDSSFPMYRWETTITNDQLAEKIGGVGTILNLTVTERGVGGIAKKVRVEGADGIKTISGEEQIRSRLGNKALKIIKNDGSVLTDWDSLPSAFIHIENAGVDDKNVTTFRIYGGGFGHGAGMSQNGAQAMAKEGKTCEEILKFFYHGVEIYQAGKVPPS